MYNYSMSGSNGSKQLADSSNFVKSASLKFSFVKPGAAKITSSDNTSKSVSKRITIKSKTHTNKAVSSTSGSSGASSAASKVTKSSEPLGGISANVGRICPGWTDTNQQPPRGNLIFDAQFESGNLEEVHAITDCEYRLSIRADTRNSRYRVWFYFSVENCRNNQRVVFHVLNYTKAATLFEKGWAAPVVRSSKQPKWRRLPERQVQHATTSPDGQTSQLTFWYLFDNTKSVFEFALCFPYTYTRLQKYLSALVTKQRSSFIRRSKLATSLQHRPIDLLTITDGVKENVKKPTIVVTARVHPGETPSSIVCQGLIDFLVSNNEEAAELRDQFVFKIVPMLNPDGVCNGNYRCSSDGEDLNRQWTSPTANGQPEIFFTKQLLLDTNNNHAQDAPVVLYLDIHGHTQRPGAFIYGNVYDDDLTRCHRQFVLPQLLSNLATDFDMTSTQLNTDPNKDGSSRRVFAELLDRNTLCYTLEASLFSYRTVVGNSKFTHTVPYTEDAYLALGANVAQAILQFSQVQRGERVCVLQPIQKRRTNNNQTVLTSKMAKLPKTTNANSKLKS